MTLLFLIQTLVGGATQHYRAELSNFFGINLALYLPYNVARTWHIQLAIFWVATSYLAAGIFLVPMITGREPKHQDWLAYALLFALAVVVFGSMAGEFVGIHGGFGTFLVVVWRPGLRVSGSGPLLADAADGRPVVLGDHSVPRIARAAARRSQGQHAVVVFLLRTFDSRILRGRTAGASGLHFTTTDFWRFWVVHLWVEDFLELFTTIMVAYIFVLLGVVHERVALAMIYLDIVLYSAGGVIGTMHHLYFSGEPAEHMALGAFFSAAEVIPLTFLTVEAWSFLQLGTRQQTKSVSTVSAFLGCDVSRVGRVLEFPRRGRLRLPDQPADRFLLRNRNGIDGQSRSRRNDGSLWDAGGGTGIVLPALSDPGLALVGSGGENLILVVEHWIGVDGVCDPLSARSAAAFRVHQPRIFRSAEPGLSPKWNQLAHRVAEISRRRGFHSGRRGAAALPVLVEFRYRAPARTLEEPGNVLFTEITRPAERDS